MLQWLLQNQSIYQTCMQSQNPNLDHHINTIKSNISKMPALYQNDAAFIKSLSNADNISKSDAIKIQTFFNLTQPAFTLLNLQQPHQQVLYPVALVVANKNEENECYSVSLKFATWVQSGGTRCIPIKITASDKDIQQYIQITHCTVFCEFPPLSQSYIKFIETFIEVASKQTHYPILFIGATVVPALQYIKKTKIQYDTKSQNGLSQIFISYDSLLFKGLDLALRLQLENRKKISYPLNKINVKLICQLGLQIKGRMKLKNNEQIACLVEQKQSNKYFLLNDPCNFDNPESIQFWHCLILNFIDITKSYKKQVDEKKVDKKLLAQNKIVHKLDKSFYRIG